MSFSYVDTGFEKYCFMWCGVRGCECERRGMNGGELLELDTDYEVEYKESLYVVWEDLTAKFKKAVEDDDAEMKERIMDTIYNLEKIFPHMQDWYLHTKSGEDK